MGRRLNTSTPTVIQTELVPLDDSFYIERIGEEQQWYYDNTRQYKPNRLLIPLELIPHLTAVDKDTKQEYSSDGGTLTLGSVTWTVRAYDEQQGKYVDTTVSSVTSSDEYYLVGNNLMVRKNVSYSHAVTIFCSASYNDPRDTGVAYVVNDQVMLLTSRDANIEYPNLDIMCPSSQSYNPLLDESSEFTMKAKADFDAVTSQSGKPYRADPLGTEEIVPQNDSDGVVTVAPTIDIRYGDVEQYDQTFMRRQTGGGVLSAIDGNKAYLQKVKGNSVAWNQLVIDGDFATSETWGINGVGTKTVSNNILTFTIAAGTAQTNVGIKKNIGSVLGHKYYVNASIKTNNNSSGSLFIGIGASSSPYAVNATGINDEWVNLKGIITPSTNETEIIYVGQIRAREGVVLQYKNAFAIDLTLMFGAGNEPTTVEEFEAWLAANVGQLDYYPYNAGELVNVKMTGIKSVGFNQWDEQWEVGTYSINTGAKQNLNTRFRSKNAISVVPEQTYYAKAAKLIRLFFYDKNNQFVNYKDWMKGEFVVPSGIYYLTFVASDQYGTTYGNDICINVSDASRNGTYEAYWSKTAPFDPRKVYGKLNGAGSMVQVFPDGMRYAGIYSSGGVSVEYRDIVNIGTGEAVRNVEGVNLGDKTWTLASGTTDVFATNIADIVVSLSQSMLLCGKFTTLNGVGKARLTDKQICQNNDGQDKSTITICVKDSAYSDGTSFKTSVNGVQLFYGLNEPLHYTDCMYSEDGGQTYIPLDRAINYEWYGISNNTEVKADTMPWYRSGQNTDTLVVDAMYGEDIRVVLRAKDEVGNLIPPKAYRSIHWRIPDTDTNVKSDNGGAVRSDTKQMTFDTIVNVKGTVLSEEKKKANLRFNWVTRYDNSSQEVDKGWGQKKTIQAQDLVNVHGNATTLVFPYVYLLGAYEQVTEDGIVVTENGETVYDRPL